jgi:hypothetical protein
MTMIPSLFHLNVKWFRCHQEHSLVRDLQEDQDPARSQGMRSFMNRSFIRSTALPNNSHPGRWPAHAHRIVRESLTLHLSRPMPMMPLLGKLPAGFWSTLTADLEDFLPNNSLLSCNSSSRGDRLDAQRIKP